MAELYDDFYKYLENYTKDSDSFLEGQEELIGFIRAHTGMDKEKVEIILSAIFTEIRNAMFRGEIVNLPGFGIISCLSKNCKAVGRKKRINIFPKFREFYSFSKKIRDA